LICEKGRRGEVIGRARYCRTEQGIEDLEARRRVESARRGVAILVVVFWKMLRLEMIC